VLLTLLGVGSGVAIWLFNRPLRAAMSAAEPVAGATPTAI
jgi:hypothetical protein